MDPELRTRIYSDTLIPALEAEDQIFLQRIAEDYQLEFEEIQELSRAARDLEMWRETSLATLWQGWETEIPGNNAQRKSALLTRFQSHLDGLRTQAKIYPNEPLRGLARAKATLTTRPAPSRVFTLCPFFSEEANCCGLHTIEAASGCALGCSFCVIGSTLGDKVEFSADLADRLADVELEPDRFYHISTGEFSDSLLWGNRHGMLDALFDFSRRHPNVQLEFKTKSDRIDYLRRHEPPSNIVCTWLVNTDTIIRNEEHGTATLHGRLHAARAVADRGYRIGFHLNPIVRYQGWREDYSSLVGQMMALFSPEELEFVSMGVASFTRALVREIRHRGGESKALQMPLVEDPRDRLTYPEEVRIALYSALYQAMQPWQGKVFVFLCMETRPVWRAVLGETVAIGDELERIFSRHQ
jgi:spore photoproduct lyase